MISGFQNSESYPDMLFNKKEYQKRSLESASERVLARNAQLEVALSRWLLSKEGPPLDFFHLKTHGKEPLLRQKSWNQPPKFT